MSLVYYKLCKMDSSLIMGKRFRLLLKLTVEHVK